MHCLTIPLLMDTHLTSFFPLLVKMLKPCPGIDLPSGEQMPVLCQKRWT